MLLMDLLVILCVSSNLMATVSCIECDGASTFVSISDLRCHYSILHPSCVNFRCGEKNCLRSFGFKWDSFRKHLDRAHKIPLHCIKQVPSTFPVPQPEDYDEAECSNFQIYSEDINEGTQFYLVQDFEKSLKAHADILIAKWLSKPGLPRSQVDSVVEDTSAFLTGGFMNILKTFVLGSLENLGEVGKIYQDTKCMFELISQCFTHLSSDYKRFQHFGDSGYYIPPETYTIDSRIDHKKTKTGEMRYEMVAVTGQFISLSEILTKFLQMPHVFNDSLVYLASVKHDDRLKNITQSEIWTRKLQKYNDFDKVLPLILYYDDYEPNNPLGPHCEKLGAVYVLMPFLPPEYQSRLENIMLALLFNADDRRLYGNKKTFHPLIQEFKSLETQGITISISEETFRVFFVLAMIIGDNLGIHSMCGFVESFTANHPCRCCKATKTQTESLLIEVPSLLRTKNSYLVDAFQNDTFNTGIKEKCVFCDLEGVDIPDDIGWDAFHDTAEGVCHYSMIPILKNFHEKNGSFLGTLNDRMYGFDFGIDSANKPPSITPEVLNKTKLKMTGAEMFTFVKLFGVLIGDVIEENNMYWHLYLLLHDIVSIVQAKILPPGVSEFFSFVIAEHHKLYIELTGFSLKPKHHFLTHYPRFLAHGGTYANISSIRPEGKHKELKASSNVVSSRRNLPKSVAIKQQLKWCYRFISKQGRPPILVPGSGQHLALSELPNYTSWKSLIPRDLEDHQDAFVFKWIEYKGTVYKQGMILLTGVDDHSCPLFAQIAWIIASNTSPVFICTTAFTLGYYEHVRGYEIVLDESCSWACFSPGNLLDPFPHSLCRMNNGDLIVVLKYYV